MRVLEQAGSSPEVRVVAAEDGVVHRHEIGDPGGVHDTDVDAGRRRCVDGERPQVRNISIGLVGLEAAASRR